MQCQYVHLSSFLTFAQNKPQPIKYQHIHQVSKPKENSWHRKPVQKHHQTSPHPQRKRNPKGPNTISVLLQDVSTPKARLWSGPVALPAEMRNSTSPFLWLWLQYGMTRLHSSCLKGQILQTRGTPEKDCSKSHNTHPWGERAAPLRRIFSKGLVMLQVFPAAATTPFHKYYPHLCQPSGLPLAVESLFAK